MQTVWLNLLQKASTIRSADSVRFWLMTVARHEAIRVSKRHRRHALARRWAKAPTPRPSIHSAASRTSIGWRHCATRSARLDEECRTLLVTLYSAASYREAAEALGRPIGSLGPTKGRCEEKLKRLLGLGGGGADD